MLKSHERFHSANGRRLVLVADDEFANRELLRMYLQDTYDVIIAENGQEALEAIRANKEVLSLVMLDLMMPVLSGLDVLKEVHNNLELSKIPIIVVTSDQDAEVECLNLGANDFVPKPYPRQDVIMARANRIIELYEDRDIISSTERDTLTGLYNREYFYRYAEQYDRHHSDTPMDAIVVDVNHFHMINERFGTAYGDNVLRSIGQALRETVVDIDGIVCRRQADTFMIYCPHGKDYEAILERASAGLSGESSEDAHIWLRMGVYPDADKELDIERRFDRAKMAADFVQGSFTKKVGVYDSALHERELYSEQLIEDFTQAIKEHQFQVYYQPKFDVQTDIPVLASAEALVRWQHPTLGLISPGVFIPLFEENGLIQQLDLYVWHAAAKQIKEWKDRFDFVVPVSVNVSRIDMYDPHLVETLVGILHQSGLSAHEFYLEITESAYTQDSEQIIETVNKLRDLGFKVEMDDFGTGYSSLNMISTLPIDALKLDMQFIRNAFSERRDTRMLEVIIDIADYLSVPVIAEGVETEEQMIALREMGCDYVQGYYFSRPIPAEEYEKFVLERKELPDESPYTSDLGARRSSDRKEAAFGDIEHALSSGFEAIYYVDVNTNHYIEFSSEGKREDLQIESSGLDFFEDMEASLVQLVCDEDRDRVRLSIQKDALLAQLAGSQPLMLTYRIALDGKPVIYTLKAVRAHTHDDHHIVIGISNVDEQIKQMDIAEPVNQLNFSSLAQALSSDMESIYYIDTNSDTYMEFKAEGVYKNLTLEVSGSDFFGECKKNIHEVVYPDDRERVAAGLDKAKLLSILSECNAFSMVYRLVIDSTPMFYRMKIVRAEGADNHHIIVGVSNIDSQIAEEDRLAAQRQSTVTYASIVQALAADYFSIYYVNTDTDHFIEYSSHEQYQELNIEKSGDDFFNMSRHNITRVVHPDDAEMFLSAFTKENVLAELESDKAFTLTYRLMFGSAPTYVHMKATRMEDRSDPHIVIGVSNIDDQMRREQEYARALRMANQDALTGVKSLHAYTEEERRINQAIAEGNQQPFAVAVCDVNGLKQVNDTYGHAAGDQYIKDACSIVCNVFKRSPVFRVGGDEFVAILAGSDYASRDELMQMLDRSNEVNRENDGVLIAGGIAVSQPGQDESLSAVFDRADTAMYENKNQLKSL